jgi:hypothetical protein
MERGSMLCGWSRARGKWLFAMSSPRGALLRANVSAWNCWPATGTIRPRPDARSTLFASTLDIFDDDLKTILEHD